MVGAESHRSEPRPPWPEGGDPRDALDTCLALDLHRDFSVVQAAATAANLDFVLAEDAAAARGTLTGGPVCVLVTSRRGLRGLRTSGPVALDRCYVLLVHHSRQPHWSRLRGVDGMLRAPLTVVAVRMHLAVAQRLHRMGGELQTRELAAKAALDYAVSVVNTVHEPFVVMDRALCVRTANPSFYRVFGLDPERVTGCPLPLVGHGEWSDPRLLAMLEAVFEGQPEFSDFELQVDYRTIQVSAKMVTSPGRWLLMSMLDVTAQRLVLQNLRSNEEFYRNQIEGASQHAGTLAAAYAKECRISQALERTLLRDLQPERFAGLQIESFYEASLDEARVGGDFYDAFPVGTAVALVVGDASGKGLLAAQRTVEVRYSLRAFLLEEPSPAPALLRVNRMLLQQPHDPEGFVAAVVTVLWPDGRMWTTAAGMEGPLVVGRTSRLWPSTRCGLPLGVDPRPSYEGWRGTLSIGEILVMFTDGLTDVRRGNRLLGASGLSKLVARATDQEELHDLGEQVLREVHRHGRVADDACMLLARRRA